MPKSLCGEKKATSTAASGLGTNVRATEIGELRVTWRIILFSKWLITMVSKSPNWGYSSLPNGLSGL